MDCNIIHYHSFNTLPRFSIWVSKEISWLIWFFVATLCDWLKNLASLSHPIRSKTKINHDLPTRVFPRLGAVGSSWGICFEFWLVHWIVCVLLWLAGVSFLRHQIENCSMTSIALRAFSLHNHWKKSCMRAVRNDVSWPEKSRPALRWTHTAPNTQCELKQFCWRKI